MTQGSPHHPPAQSFTGSRVSVLQPLRDPLPVLEGRRQQQLMGLQSLCPDHPTQLLADYRAVAIKFELYQVRF